MEQLEQLIIYTDGASRGNPGEAAIGVLICASDGSVVEELGEAIGHATNNVAEYTALVRGLERARALGARRVRVLADSELMVRQLQGRYAVKSPDLQPLYRDARRLSEGFTVFDIEHIPRGKNREADRLANAALDERAGRATVDAGPQGAEDLPDGTRRVEFRLVDAFTRRSFGGNPAGVVLDASGLTDEEMQGIAREVNASETAFFLPPSAGGDFRLRYFSPTREVDLCGHATVAAFHVLVEEGRLSMEAPGGTAVCRLETPAGVLSIEVLRGDAGAEVMMGQAAPRFRPFEGDVTELAACLGLEAADLTDFSVCGPALAYTGLWHLMVPVRGLEAVKRAAPDQARLARLNTGLGVDTTHLYCVETEDPAASVHARAFAPVLGIAEDPQTGTASGALGAYLVHCGAVEAAPVAEMLFEQGHSLGRPGLIRVEVTRRSAGQGGTDEGAGSALRVRVGGPAVTVLRGKAILP